MVFQIYNVLQSPSFFRRRVEEQMGGGGVLISWKGWGGSIQIFLFWYICRVRPYYREYTWTRPISEVKPGQA